MGLSTPPPTWSTIKNKPTTVAGLGLSDFNASAISAQAAASAGGVGTYAMMYDTTLATRTIGATLAGSSLKYGAPSGSSLGPTSTGTWRLMGDNQGGNSQNSTNPWIRIA